jgi:FtsH-binding integral membrane protein
MNDFNTSVGSGAETDVGLKSFMLGTYRYMAMAMLVTAAVAYVSAPFVMQSGLMKSPFVLLGFVIAIPVLFGAVGAKLPSMSKGGVLAFLFGFAAFLGVFVSAITVVYPSVVLAKVFFMTVAMFGALSLFGYTTERNLGAFIKYAIAAFVGYVAISLLGAFFPALQPTGPLDIIINIVALAAIAMITAWETQMLKRIYYGSSGDALMMQKLSAYGAASLLLAFVNMFQILLSLFGRE